MESQNTEKNPPVALSPRSISWTPTKLLRFKQAYDEAVLAGLDEFVFVPDLEGPPATFFTDYAKYLIEYLEGKFTQIRESQGS